MEAVQKNDETLVELFLRFGVSVNALMRLPSWTLTPLCQAGTRRMVELLLAKVHLAFLFFIVIIFLFLFYLK
jgi:hypothetical protein